MANVEQIDPGMTSVAPPGAAGDQTGMGTPQGQFTYKRVANGDTHTVRDAQTYLNAHGYNVGVDGMWGPQTSRALKNYLNAIHPNAHNARESAIANKHPQTGRFQGTQKPMKNTNPGPIGGRNKLAKGGKPGRSGGGGGNMAPPPGVQNPQKQAQSMANAEYDPAISSLKQALLNLVTQGKYDQKQVGGMYDQMGNLMNQQSAEQGSNQDAALQDVTKNLGNVASLFGAQNAAQMQPAVGNATGLIGAEGKSEQDYLANMLPLLKAQAAQGNANVDNLVMGQQRNYNDQLTTQQQAKGQAYNADYQQALSDQATQQQNALALRQAQAMMPYQIGSAKAQLKVDRANAAAAPGLNRAKLQTMQAQAMHDAALSKEAASTITKNLAYARKAAMTAKGKGGAAVLAPGSTTFNRVQANLYHAMSTSDGKNTIVNPVRAQHALFSAAVAQGLIDRRGRPLVNGALKLLNSTLGGMYQRDSAWQNSWTWTGSKFVPKKS